MQQWQRTQICLPKNLRQEIDKDRREENESLAEYLRKAAEERLARKKKQEIDLKKVANNFIGSSTKTDKEIQEWLGSIREDRRLSDERLEKQWTRAVKKHR